MKLLLDTCALSELKRPHPYPKMMKIIQESDNNDLFISTLSVGEIEKGIALLEDLTRKHSLQQWIYTLEKFFADRILDIDVEICRIWGKITAETQKSGRILPAVDGLIAATAIKHDLHVVTRNVVDFESTGVPLINPWLKN